MKIGVLDILAWPGDRLGDRIYRYIITKQYASVMPQAVSVWCRQLGHDVHYATYYGQGNPERHLPRDLDVVFIACYSRVSPLAYALAKIFRRRGTLTVIGGPHAKAFSRDCLRFFDIAVKECDKDLIRAILAREFGPGSVVSSSTPFTDIPPVEERMPEIARSSFAFGRRPYYFTNVPMLTSTGCPYDCNFCIDGTNPYRQLPLDRLAEDLRFLDRRFPGMLIGIHDPNFAVKFDQVIDTLIDTLPPSRRVPYIMETSLTVLKPGRIKRLAESNCVVVAPGIESWNDYAKKGGAGKKEGREKLERVVEQFAELREHIPYLQANFMFGVDTDAGDEPVELTKEFMRRTPFVWPLINVPQPYGGTPLQRQYLADGRVLRSMPFSFYYTPYLVTTLKHYDPITYFRKLLELDDCASAPQLLKRRIAGARDWRIAMIHRVRTYITRSDARNFRHLLRMLETDRQFLAFHEGRTDALPEFYHHEFERLLGRYAPLISRSDRRPVLEDADSSPILKPADPVQIPIGIHPRQVVA